MDILIDNPERTRRGGEVGEATFSDIPGFTMARWRGKRLLVRFDRDLSTEEQQKVRDRCETVTVTEEQLRTDLRAYLNITNPNTQQTRDQVRRLTRLLLGDNGTE